MLISLIVTNGVNFKEIEEPSLTALGDLEWNDPKTLFVSAKPSATADCRGDFQGLLIVW